ncbi:MAG: carboxypeptidase-like regulatory domain-containing protein, partial [Bryobacter sp.]|nr:carboxypeptidase-like regulatory domain-containing protein [Bryobacter sp.]
MLLVSGQTPGIRGVVRDASGGEPLARVRVLSVCGETKLETVTDGEGRFAVVAEGDCVVQASAVGYRPARTAAHAPAEIEIILTPDQLSRRESVEVSAGVFEAATVSSPSERTLTGPELKNLAGVLADDPLRAVQSLPGVAANNDYVAQFAVRGASFS